MSRTNLIRVTVILVLPFFFQMTARLAFAQDAEVSLEVTLVSFSEATGFVEFDVHSHSETPVVAWDIAVVVRHSNGNEFVSTFGWDYWLAGPDSYLENGDTRRGKLTISPVGENAELGDPPVELIPASVVFSDGRSAGRTELVEGIFLLRAGTLAEFCRAAAVFDAALETVYSNGSLRDSLRVGVDSIADAPIPEFFPDKAAPDTQRPKPTSSASDMFGLGVLTQRKVSVEFLTGLEELLDDSPGNQTDKIVTWLQREAANHRRYCSEANDYLRRPDLEIEQPLVASPDQRSQQ